MSLHHHILDAAFPAIEWVEEARQRLRSPSSPALRVLLYHDIAPHDQAQFASQLRWLARSWNFVSPEEFLALKSGAVKIERRSLLLSFDDGFASNRKVAEEVLNPLGIRALFFVISNFVGIEDHLEAKQFISRNVYPGIPPDALPAHWRNMGWGDLEALLEQGHCVGSHTRSHARLSTLPEDELKREIVESGDAIALRLGTQIDHFAYTFGDAASFSARAMEIARERYRYIYSGVRGDNTGRSAAFTICRDASALQDSKHNYHVFSNRLVGSFLAGVADRHYARSRNLLDQWSCAPSSSPGKKRARVIAFYLPQFHPIPENDAWWGKGFTEWTNVVKARPLFDGHEQPHIPADLGFYDLRLPETRAAQASLASTYGIEGFCYWHYWFAGRTLLQRPFEEVLSSGTPNFPFCLGWANETWTGVWRGEPNRILVEQTYPGVEDDKAHFEYLVRAFRDHRYITVEGKPLLVIYKPLKMPNARQRFDYWRNLALEAGLKGLYIIGTNMLDFDDAEQFGLDGAMVSTMGVVSSSNKLVNSAKRVAWGVRRRLSLGGPRVIDYSDAIRHLIPDLSKFNFAAYPTIFPNWDHTPRMGRKGVVLANSTPELFEKHVRDAMYALVERDDEHRIIFLKSWNEWAEGNYVEPDTKWGHAYLEALARVIR